MMNDTYMGDEKYENDNGYNKHRNDYCDTKKTTMKMMLNKETLTTTKMETRMETTVTKITMTTTNEDGDYDGDY